MKLMHVDGSPRRDWSNSRALSAYFIERLRHESMEVDVDYLDVTVDTPFFFNDSLSIEIYTPPKDRTSEMSECLAASDAICQRLLQADALLFAMPMYNFSIPSAFKAFVDNIVRAGVTYKVSPEGQYVGQLSRQKVVFVTSRGADFRPGSPFESYDALTPSLRAAFGFIGVASPVFIDAQPLQFADPEARAGALQRARSEIEDLAVAWSQRERASALTMGS